MWLSLNLSYRHTLKYYVNFFVVCNPGGKITESSSFEHIFCNEVNEIRGLFEKAARVAASILIL